MSTDYSALFDFGNILNIVLYSCLGFLILLLLIYVGYSVYISRKRARAYIEKAKSWPSTSGTVIASSTKSYKSGRNSSRTYYADIHYEYVVNGQSFKNTLVKAGEHFIRVTHAEYANETVERYPVGAKVTVYFDPVNPKDSVLER